MDKNLEKMSMKLSMIPIIRKTTILEIRSSQKTSPYLSNFYINDYKFGG